MAVSGTSDDELAAIEATAISYLTAFNRAALWWRITPMTEC